MKKDKDESRAYVKIHFADLHYCCKYSKTTNKMQNTQYILIIL